MQSKSETSTLYSDLRAAFEAMHALDESTWRSLEPLLEKQLLKRDSYFIRVGDKSCYMGFIQKGLLRAYYTTFDGKEVITNFCAEGDFVCAYPAAIQNMPSRACIQALEDTELVRFDVLSFRRLFSQHPSWGEIGRKMVERYFMFQERRIADLLTLDAQALLLRFRETHQHLMPRLQRRHMASYLGISREALSRISISSPKK